MRSTVPAPMADRLHSTLVLFAAAEMRYVDARARAPKLGTIVDQPRGS
jgi:hypothetical protein